MAERSTAFLSNAWRLAVRSLSGRLLILTVVFVMISQILIYFPSIGREHGSLLSERIAAAEIAILPFTEATREQFSARLRMELLSRAGVLAVIVMKDDQRELFLVDVMPPSFDTTIDLRGQTVFGQIYEAMACLLAAAPRTIRVVDSTRLQGGETVEIIAEEVPIRRELIAFSWRVLLFSLFISGLTAILVFVSLYYFIVRPMEKLTEAMIAFRANPEDPGRILAVSDRRDEIGIAERELAAMQRELYGFLQQKNRLAALGLAVAKIQHDLRNMLASAQLASDRLAALDDPVVQRLAPRIVAALDRAISLATNTLRYGKAEERAPQRRRVALAPLVAEAEMAAMSERTGIRLVEEIAEDLEIDADPEQIFRVLLNVLRNAVEAIESKGGVGTIRVTARRASAHVEIEIADDGPGMPDAVKARLFRPFAGAARPGGSGLGLAIARELIRAHGGDIALVRSDAAGTAFMITIPDVEG